MGIITDQGLEIREQGPLKQGLKQDMVDKHHIILKIREQGPLKQGLKHPLNRSLPTRDAPFVSKVH